jgi:hypothetical protein
MSRVCKTRNIRPGFPEAQPLVFLKFTLDVDDTESRRNWMSGDFAAHSFLK